MTGLWEGIKAKFAEITGPLANIASSIAGIFRRETDTHSPSRVFEAIGRDIMAGLAQGLDGEKAGIQSGMQDFAQEIAGQFRGILEGSVKFREALGNVLGSLGDRLVSNALGGLGKSIGIPGFANGGISAGGLAWVGERGPELVHLPRGARVTPNSEIGLGGQAITYAPVFNVTGASSADMAQLRAQVAAQGEEFKRTFGARVARATADPRFRGSF